MATNFVNAVSSFSPDGFNPAGTSPANSKPPSAREQREEARRQEQFTASVFNAQALTGAPVDGGTISEAQAKLATAPSATQLARSGGGSLRSQQAALPGELQQQSLMHQVNRLVSGQQKQQVAAEFQQTQQAIAEAEALGLIPDPALTERLNQLTASYQQLEQNEAQAEREHQSNTLATLMRADDIANRIRQLAEQTTAFLKDAGARVGESNQKPVKVRPPNFSLEIGEAEE